MSWQSLLLRLLLRALSSTWRYRERVPADVARLLGAGEPMLVVFWHGKMLPVWYRFGWRGCSALISGSRDGELLAGYLTRSLGYEDVIRGSSSKGGSRALAELVETLRERSCLMTPDGPRGPARRGKPGALVAAGRSGRALVGVGWSCRRSVVLGSWDRMEIPWPFSRINIRYCKINIPHNNTSRRAAEETTGNPAVHGLPDRVGPSDLDAFDSLLDSLCDQP